MSVTHHRQNPLECILHSSSFWAPFQTHYFSGNLVALGIEPGTSGFEARNSEIKENKNSSKSRDWQVAFAYEGSTATLPYITLNTAHFMDQIRFSIFVYENEKQHDATAEPILYTGPPPPPLKFKVG
jgi:hypothetical protein